MVSTETNIYSNCKKPSERDILMEGINIAALALMSGVLFQLGLNALVDVLTCVLALLSLIILLRFKINSIWLLLAGAIIGVIYFWVR